MSWHLLQSPFLINANNSPKYSFRGFRGVNASKSWEVALNHSGCSLTDFAIFANHFILFNSNPGTLKELLWSKPSKNITKRAYFDHGYKLATLLKMCCVTGGQSLQNSYFNKCFLMYVKHPIMMVVANDIILKQTWKS